MRFDATISRSSLIGMVAISWVSILLLGGAWIVNMYLTFRVESDELRAGHYAGQKAMVKTEVESAVALIETVRRTRLDELVLDIQQRNYEAEALAKSLANLVSPSMTDDKIGSTLVDIVSSTNRGGSGLYFVHGESVYLLDLFPPLVNAQDALGQIVDLLEGVDSGDRQFSLTMESGMQEYTMLVSVKQAEGMALRIVTGACLEVAEEAVKSDVVEQLEAIRFGFDGTLFGGTWRGYAVVGPAKGKNMWNVSDVNGVKIVQELIAAAQRGGGFVSYVMPPLEGQRHTDKVSYAMGVADWEWYVGAGLYVDDIEFIIAENREKLKHDIFRRAGGILVGLVFLSMISYIVSRRLSQRMQAQIRLFTDVWNKASTRGVEIDSSALHYGEFKDLAMAANSMARDRHRAEEDLAESVQRFKTLVSNIPGIVYHRRNDAQWTMKYVSESVFEMAGYPATEFLVGTRSFDSIIHPDDKAWVVAAIAEDVKRRVPYSLEYRIVHANGEVRWMSERGQARYDESGTPLWLDGVIFDITAKKKSDDEYYTYLHFLETMERVDRDVRRSTDIEMMLSDVLETVRQAFSSDRAWLLFPCDPDAPSYTIPMERTAVEYPGALALGLEVPMSEETREICKLALASSEPVAFAPSSGRARSWDIMEQFGVRSQLVTAVYPRIGEPWMMGMHQCRDARVWNSDEIRLFKEVCRRVADALSSMLMIRQLHESEEKFRTFSQQTMLGLCVVQDNKVVFANQAYCDIFEMSVDDMLALPAGAYIKLVHPDDRALILEQARKKQAGDKDVVPSYTWRALTSTGRVRWVEIHSRTITLNGRNADLVSLVDNTEKKLAEENLEQIIAERTEALAQKADELAMANMRLTKLDEIKSSFLTTVSHDLRTPLTSVLGYAKLVRRDLRKVLDEAGKESVPQYNRVIANLEVMESEGKRLTRLIDDFLDMTTIEAGVSQWYDRPVSTEKSILRALKLAETKLDAKSGVSLITDIVGDLPELTVDPDRFEQLLGNLLDNAIKFTHEGQIVLQAKSPDGKSLEIALSDTGKGIPEGDLVSVFDVFHQVETGDTLVDGIKGSGLGLALCSLIVEHYGGKIWAESSLGDGCTFHVWLPGSD